MPFYFQLPHQRFGNRRKGHPLLLALRPVLHHLLRSVELFFEVADIAMNLLDLLHIRGVATGGSSLLLYVTFHKELEESIRIAVDLRGVLGR